MTDPQLPPPPPSGNVPPAPFPSGSAPEPAAPQFQGPDSTSAAPQYAPPPQYGSAAAYTAPATSAYPTIPSAQTYQEAPNGAYGVPLGGYGAPAGNYQLPHVIPPKGSSRVGIVAFLLSLVAAVIAPIFAAVGGYQIGYRMPDVMDWIDSADIYRNLSYLAPVRDQVLFVEIFFWVGTVTGIAAIVLGIVAIAKRSGRGFGIAALIIAALAPIILFVMLAIGIAIGAVAGVAVGY